MFTKKFVYIAIAISCLLAILFLHNQITGSIITLTTDAAQTGSGRLATEIHSRYHNVVITGIAGIVLFCLLRALELHLSEKDLSAQKFVKYSHMTCHMLRWAVVLVSGDIVLENIRGTNSTIFNYSMKYQTLGALLAIELIILVRFYCTRNNKETTEQPQ